MTKFRQLGLALLATAAIGLAPAAAQVRGTIERVGLSGGGLSLIRSGSWTTVDVQLGNDGSATFEGTLRVEQFDRDRDVAVATLPVALLGGQSRPYQVYFLPSSARSGDNIRVQLFDNRGVLMPMRDAGGQPQPALLSNQIEIIHASETVVVDLSNSRLAQAILSSRPKEFEYYQNRNIRAIAAEPRGLPNRWHGLECADAIVWDDADPSTVDGDQLTALADWVRNGGRLLITCAPAWQSLAASNLGPILPVKLSGVQQMTRGEAIALLPNFLSENEEFPESDAPVTRCVVALQGLPGESERLSPDKSEGLVYRRRVGRGNVVFLASTFRELFSPLVSSKRLTGKNGDLNATADESGDIMNESNRSRLRILFRSLLAIPDPPRATNNVGMNAVDPYAAVTQGISFQQRAGLYLLFSVLFAAGYCLAATLGTWYWLGRRNWRHHAWTAFTCVAILGSVVGIGAVTLLHGFTMRVNDVQVIDARANLSEARATCLFGLRTPAHMTVSLRLPTESGASDDPQGAGPIGALPPLMGFGHEASGYVAPATYTLDQNGRAMDNVAVRATLKEFAGHWEGNLDGRVDARLIEKYRTVLGTRVDYIADGSFIRNNLSVDLRNCYLLDTRQEFVRRPDDVRCFPVGTLKKGEERRDFSAWFRKPVSEAAAALADAAGATEEFRVLSDLPNLRTSIGAWGKELQSLFRQNQDGGTDADSLSYADKALLLLATYDVYRPETYGTEQSPIERTGGRAMGCLQQLGEHHAVLIGFADATGPARLEVNRELRVGTNSTTMYRILIPVERE